MAADPDANASAQGDADITTASALVRTLVLEAREDLEIARETRGVAGKAAWNSIGV